MTGLHLCSSCQRALPRAAFHADRCNPRGFRAQCKTCRIELSRPADRPRFQPKVNAAGDVFCPGCAAFLPPDRFDRNRSNPSGYASRCKVCRTADLGRTVKPAAAPKPVPPPVVPPPKPTCITVPRRASKPAPAPKPTPPTKSIVAIKPSPRPKTLPMGDPALCVHPARPCDALDGLSLVATLHEGNICGAIVRGWTATIDADARGLVQPRFETTRSRDLFDEMLSVRTGHRERRQAA